MTITNFTNRTVSAPTPQTSPTRSWRGPGRILEQEPVHERSEAQAYDEMIQRHFRILNRPFVDLACRLLPASGRVLDVGCGPGWIPIEIAKRRPRLELWALDPSQDMLERAQRNAETAGVAGRIRFRQGRAEELPFEDGFFQACCSNFVLHHLDRPEQLLDEMARVTAPGGRVLLKDLRRKARLQSAALLWFSKWILRYSPLQLALYRDSIHAALTLPEARQAVARSRLAGATVKGYRGLDFVIIR